MVDTPFNFFFWLVQESSASIAWFIVVYVLAIPKQAESENLHKQQQAQCGGQSQRATEQATKHNGRLLGRR